MSSNLRPRGITLTDIDSFCSPRVSARRAAEILRLVSQNIQYFYDTDSDNFLNDPDVHKQERSIRVTSMLREWDYGDYEGLTLAEIHRQRGKQSLPRWDIGEQGCPGGESPQEVSDRVDKLIGEIRKVILENSALWPNGQIVGPALGPTTVPPQDIVCISHGHILAALTLRWCGTPLGHGPKRMLIQPGGVVVLGYVSSSEELSGWVLTVLDARFEHDNIENPALMIGRNPGRAEGTL